MLTKAVKKPLSCRLLAKTVKIVIIPTRPMSAGDSKRARNMPITTFNNWVAPLVNVPQISPFAALSFSDSMRLDDWLLFFQTTKLTTYCRFSKEKYHFGLSSFVTNHCQRQLKTERNKTAKHIVQTKLHINIRCATITATHLSECLC